MPRPTRLAMAGIPWHIIQRGNNQSACFYADEDGVFYLETLLISPHADWLALGRTSEGRYAAFRRLFDEHLKIPTCGRQPCGQERQLRVE